VSTPSSTLEPFSGWRWCVVAIGALAAFLAHCLWAAVYAAPQAERDRNDGLQLDNEQRELLRVAATGAKADGYKPLLSHGWPVAITVLLCAFLIVAVSN
jgi:hypothetical protein